nr:lanthionine synthetase C family protein [Streptacidiphilus neutrinimicus]
MNRPLDFADTVADLLAVPNRPAGMDDSVWRQSLAHGIPGIILLHTELAAAGRAPWLRVHDWLTAATHTALIRGESSHPFHGTPALATALAHAAGHFPGAYARTLDQLNTTIEADVLRRVDTAHARIDSGRPPELAEFDVIRGLTGYGAYLLRHHPASKAVPAVLCYLVRLTEPLTVGEQTVPGWWTWTGPSGLSDDRFPYGHANAGVAHGIGGPLALMGLATRAGTSVPGLLAAISTVLAWLDYWGTETPGGVVWPYWITMDDLRAGRWEPEGLMRPSWCYGAAGLARAQQLAAIALADHARQHAAETALIQAVTDPARLAVTGDGSLCHGFAGLAHLACRAATDALPANRIRLQAAVPELLDRALQPSREPEEVIAAVAADTGLGLLEGVAGIALAALDTHACWDTSLLTA